MINDLYFVEYSLIVEVCLTTAMALVVLGVVVVDTASHVDVTVVGIFARVTNLDVSARAKAAPIIMAPVVEGQDVTTELVLTNAVAMERHAEGRVAGRTVKEQTATAATAVSRPAAPINAEAMAIAILVLNVGALVVLVQQELAVRPNTAREPV